MDMVLLMLLTLLALPLKVLRPPHAKVMRLPLLPPRRGVSALAWKMIGTKDRQNTRDSSPKTRPPSSSATASPRCLRPSSPRSTKQSPPSPSSSRIMLSPPPCSPRVSRISPKWWMKLLA
eukprot:5399927-Pyramimonas_sp.AAC.1